MLSAGMLFCFASAMIVRSRGFMSGSPPPARAATVNSLMRRVKILPRLASAAPFLCLMECHLEWPDMSELQKIDRFRTGNFTTRGVTKLRLKPPSEGSESWDGEASLLIRPSPDENDPDLRALVPWA